MLARQVFDAVEVDPIEKISQKEERAVTKVQGNIKGNEGFEVEQYDFKSKIEQSILDVSGSKEKEK